MDDNIIRFLVSTDNHLGFAERDPVRCNDSLAAFEEVLLTATQQKVDFVLLAGDMFHENRPSRRTLHTAMELFRSYCYGRGEIFMEVLNEQKEVFKTSMGRVNYEDPFQAISLPVFSIHGNHDDPSRDGGSGEALAALDLFSVSNLLNYIGKVDRVDSVEVVPILISKNGTHLAVYALGAMRDERMNRMWNQKKVKFVRLTEEQGRDNYFNVFVLHQNRDYGRGKKNCLLESMIPDWMDLVIWGNEHESMPNLAKSVVGQYYISQPGSSVATSLSEGESSVCPKHMILFEVTGRKFRSHPIKYKNVRQFAYDTLALSSCAGLSSTNFATEENVRAVLTEKVQTMISQARQAISPPADTKFKVIDPEKVIIRLRVDHEGFTSVNQQRFGAQFVGQVANPSDLLLQTRRRKEGVGEGRSTTLHSELKQLIDEGAEDEIHHIKVEDLVKEALASSKNSLSLLNEQQMAQALDDYIIKKLPNAIQDLVAESLKKTYHQLREKSHVQDKSSILQALSQGRATSSGSMQGAGNRNHPSWDNSSASEPSRSFRPGAVDFGEPEPEPEPEPKQPGRRATSKKANGRASAKSRKIESDEESDGSQSLAAKECEYSDDAMSVATEDSEAPKTSRRGKQPAKTGQKKVAASKAKHTDKLRFESRAASSSTFATIGLVNEDDVEDAFDGSSVRAKRVTQSAARESKQQGSGTSSVAGGQRKRQQPLSFQKAS